MREQKRTMSAGISVPAKTGTGGRNNPNVEDLIHEIQELMWNKVGIVRMRHGLTEAVQQLQGLLERLPAPDSRRHCEARNIHAAALLIARSALARLESRGAHYRLDYPQHDDVKFKRHSVVTETGVRLV
jgi:L-aspartate oxidase